VTRRHGDSARGPPGGSCRAGRRARAMPLGRPGGSTPACARGHCPSYGGPVMRVSQPCCNMHMPMSVRSMGLTSTGHPRPGSGGPTEPLRHRRLRIAGSGPHAPRRTAGRRTSMGLRAVSGPRELRADARLEEPPAARPLGRGSREWSEGGARHGSGQADVDVTK
jgi:hypothetical protein